METKDKKTLFFEENYEIFNNEIEKRRRKWTLKGVVAVDFDDVKQILMRHLFIKLDMYDPAKSPLSHWTNTIISNQISNILRNNYYSCARPCLKCACQLPLESCELYGEQTNACSVYKKWEETKKSAHDIRLALPSENHQQEIYDIPNIHSDLLPQIAEMHLKMKKVLKKFEYRIYECLFIFNLSEIQTAKKLGYSSAEKWRKPGYASISKAKKVILEKAKKMIRDGEIDVM